MGNLAQVFKLTRNHFSSSDAISYIQGLSSWNKEHAWGSIFGAREAEADGLRDKEWMGDDWYHASYSFIVDFWVNLLLDIVTLNTLVYIIINFPQFGHGAIDGKKEEEKNP